MDEDEFHPTILVTHDFDVGVLFLVLYQHVFFVMELDM
jgi:hypothetical protein